MPSRRTAGTIRAASAPVPPLPCRVNDFRFITEYLANGNSAVRAYLKVHPNAKYSTAEVNGYRQLRKPSVQAELARRVRAEQAITKAWGESTLLRVCAEAEAAKDWALLASTAMDAMKLAGFLVEKREVKTVTEEQRSALRDLLARALPPAPATTSPTTNGSAPSPSLTPTTNGEDGRT